MERRLSAIFAADMVGYSRLMEADEVGTLERQKIHRKELVDPAFEEFHGRIVKEMGDGILVEFPSVVEAVQCAVVIQRAMPEREADVAEDRRITYRIGINLGDIIVEDDDIYGDGVNVAARLEQLAEPGGICISGTAYDQMRATVEVGYESLGELQVKNIERPIRAYRVLTETAHVGTIIEKPRRRIRPRHWAALCFLLLLAIGAGGWWWLQPDFEPADPTKFAFAIPEQPSIAVLPFVNLSGDPDQDYLGDSLTENIIAELATVPNLLVIARNSVFTYKGKAVKVQQVAEEMGVRFVLEGSVQTDGKRMRVVTQLVDALDGRHLWAERYDYEIADLFEVQDNITEKLAEELEVKLTIGEQARAWRDAFHTSEDYRMYAEGRAAFNKLNLEGHKKAERLFNELYERNPDNPSVARVLSYLQTHKSRWGLGRTLEPAEHWKLARQFAERFQTALGEHPTADLHNLLAWLDYIERKYDSAIAHVDEAVNLAPSQADAHSIGGLIKVHSQRAEEGVELLRLAMRLEPAHAAWMEVTTADGLTMLGKYEEARSLLERILPKTGGGVDTESALKILIAISMFEGNERIAKDYAEQLLELKPNANIEMIRSESRNKDLDFVERCLDALHQAGIPEHPPLKLPDKPSIAVLPFNNLSDDESQQYFVDGMVGDLITDLSKVPGLFVIARNSSFAYRGKSVDVKQVARELGVRHVLEGSVRRAGDRVRINAQLIDGQTNRHVWAERYDGTLEDVFDLQDRITSEIIDALKLELTVNARAQMSAAKTSDPLAYDLFLKGRIERQKLNGEGYSNAIRLFERAIEIDPEFSHAHAELAFAYFDGVFRGLLFDVGLTDEQEAFQKASDHLDLAFRNPTPLAYITKGYVIGLIQREHDRSLAITRRAIEVDPNYAHGYIHVAGRAALAGDPDEALDLLEIARRLDPQLRAEFHQVMGMTHYIAERYDAAQAALETAVERNPEDVFAWQLLAGVYGHLGEKDKAGNALATVNGLYKGFGPTGLVAASAYTWPFKDMEVADRLYRDFKSAGVPDPKPSLDPAMVERELKPSEVRNLLAPSITSGVMVEDNGRQTPYTQRMSEDGSAAFSIWGITWNLKWDFGDERVQTDRGELHIYRLSEAGEKEWKRQFVVFEKSFNAYYYFNVIN